VIEAGFSQLEATLWSPADECRHATRRHRIAQRGATYNMLSSPDMRPAFRSSVPMPRQIVARVCRVHASEVTNWAAVIAAAGIKLE